MEPRFIKFQARNVVQAEKMKVHKSKGNINLILEAISASSPMLYKNNFRPDANIQALYHFQPEQAAKQPAQPARRGFRAAQDHGDDEMEIDIPRYNALPIAVGNLKDKNADDNTGFEDVIKGQREYLRERIEKRKDANRVHKAKKAIAIIDSDQRLGLINMNKIKELTRAHRAEGAEKPLLPSDPENFNELKRFCNKYREKLFIQPEVKQTTVDLLETKKLIEPDKKAKREGK